MTDQPTAVERLRGFLEEFVRPRLYASEIAYLDNARAALAEIERGMEDAEEDRERLDWLEGEKARENGPLNRDIGISLFRRNYPITRSAIDAAMQQRGESDEH